MISQIEKQNIIKLCESENFSKINIAKYELLSSEIEKYNDWLAKGYSADMDWMKNYIDKREDVRLIQESTKSVIVLAYNYNQSTKHSSETNKISSYAWGDDYHNYIPKKLKRICNELKEIYPNIAALEELAEDYGVTIKEPFQGERIGEFFVLAPSISRYLDLVVDSEKTPESKRIEENTLLTELGLIAKSVINNIRSLWGEEYFPPDDTSAENNMSVVQFANICNKNILLTGDAGRAALEESIEFAPLVGLNLPGLDYVQVPHHGSRHNVSSELLDKLLGKSYPSKLESSHFTAVVSAAKKDEDHPRKSVVRAFIHRGATVVTTENGNIRVGYNKPPREGWSVVEPLPYPEEQED